MKAAAAILATAIAFPATVSAAEIWTSEAECLQRQADLKKTEDFLTYTSVEMSRASLEKAPTEGLGGDILRNREQVTAAVKQTRDLLQKLCTSLF